MIPHNEDYEDNEDGYNFIKHTNNSYIACYLSLFFFATRRRAFWLNIENSTPISE
jgi:hypothetical protein